MKHSLLFLLGYFCQFFFCFSTLFQQRNILEGGYILYLTFVQNWIVSDTLQKLLVLFSINIYLFPSHSFELLQGWKSRHFEGDSQANQTPLPWRWQCWPVPGWAGRVAEGDEGFGWIEFISRARGSPQDKLCLWCVWVSECVCGAWLQTCVHP